jgi:hypothetical protein
MAVEPVDRTDAHPDLKSKEKKMNRYKSVNAGTVAHLSRLPNDGFFFAGYNPLMWLMALLLAAVVAGCGGSDGVLASTSPGTSSTTVLPGVAGTTGANATNPTVISASPGNLATNVPTSTESWTAASGVVASGTLVTATFDAAMTPATITAAGTFTLKATTAGTNVPGSVTMNAASTVATFTPTAAALAANTKYTATVTTAAKNAGGTAMPKTVAWTFTTNATALTGQAPVNLLTAGDFAILANTQITCGAFCAGVASTVTGDVGQNSLNMLAGSGFTLTVDGSNDFATAVEVVGKLYAQDYTGGQLTSNGLTPAKLTLAGTDMTLAYNDAAGRTPAAGPPFLEAGTGNLNGLTLTPGVYTWAGNVTFGPGTGGNVTLSGGPDDVWIFQIGGYLRPGNGSTVTLVNPAGGVLPQAKNIFWQVAGSDATFGTTAHLEGVILTAGFITLNNGSTANSRLLSQTAVTLNGTVTQPAP